MKRRTLVHVVSTSGISENRPLGQKHRTPSKSIEAGTSPPGRGSARGERRSQLRRDRGRDLRNLGRVRMRAVGELEMLQLGDAREVDRGRGELLDDLRHPDPRRKVRFLVVERGAA